MRKEVENFKKYLTGIIQMDNDTFNFCLDFLKIEEIKKRDYFITEGKTCKRIAYINEGLFRIYYLKDGVEVNTCFCKENSITSSFESFVKNKQSKEFIQAIENSTLVTISNDNLLNLYELSPKWQSVSRLLTEKECLRLSSRATSLSFETAKEKYQNLLTYQPEIIQRVSIQEIASYIGVSRETLSRIRSKIAIK
jgi:CRP-like cAMP-binding protein